MAILQLANIAAAGMVTDTDSQNTPPNVFNYLANVRTQDGHISRGPVFLKYKDLTTDPRALYSTVDTNGIAHVLCVEADGTVKELFNQSGTPTDVSASGYAATSASDAIVSVAETQNVIYVNVENREVWYRQKNSSGPFALLSSYNSGAHGSTGTALAQSDPTTRFKVIRTFGPLVIGFNVRKGASLFPTMIKWSDSADFNTPPKDWDVGNGASNAGETILGEMKSEILDACRIANDMVLFSRNDSWLMQYTGDANIFNFRRLHDAGIINTNCAVEHLSKLYVFGDNDLYMTDGISRQSVGDHLVREFVFKALVETEKNKCFVTYDIANSVVHFCYVSTDPYCKFPYSPNVPAACNRSVGFNLVTQTWCAYDLPYVRCGYPITYTTSVSFDDLASTTLDGLTGTFASLSTSVSNVMMFGSMAYTSPSLGTNIPASLRLYSLFGRVTGTLDAEATAGCTILKSKVAFDDATLQGTGMKLRDVKQLTAIYPEVSFDIGAGQMTFGIGTMYGPNETAKYGVPVTCGPSSPSPIKLPFSAAGSYFAIKITYDDVHDFDLSTLDLDLKKLGSKI